MSSFFCIKETALNWFWFAIPYVKNRELKQQQRRRLRKRHLKSEFALLLFIYLPAFLGTDLLIGNAHERDSLFPCKVPSLPNPTTRKGWPHHRGLRRLLFSNSDVGSFTFHKNKSVKVLWDLKLYRAYSNSFNSSDVGKFFRSWILKDCIKV